MSLLSFKTLPKFVHYPMTYSAFFPTYFIIFAWKDR